MMQIFSNIKILCKIYIPCIEHEQVHECSINSTLSDAYGWYKPEQC